VNSGESLWNTTATDEVMAGVARQTIDEGTGARIHIAAVAPAGGIHARVLLDRGMDVGAAWVGGCPVAWLSARGERPPGHSGDGDGWHNGWAGGLLTTCGLQNVGASSEGHGRHGEYSGQPAADIGVERVLNEDATGTITVSGTVVEPIELGRGIRVRRRLEFAVGTPMLRLTDVAVNESGRSLQSPLLYHVNLGFPFLDGDTRPLLGSGPTDVPAMGEPADVPDVVTELDASGCLAVDSRRLGMRMTLEWDTAVQPRVFCWQRRRRGQYVLALEPANCSVAGRAADRSENQAPFLQPEETRRTTLTITFAKKE
jgi:hypothetical protein